MHRLLHLSFQVEVVDPAEIHQLVFLVRRTLFLPRTQTVKTLVYQTARLCVVVGTATRLERKFDRGNWYHQADIGAGYVF